MAISCGKRKLICEENKVRVMSFKTTQAQKPRFNFKGKHSRFRMALIMLEKKNPCKTLLFFKKKQPEISCLFPGVVRKSPELGFNDV